jgi:NAD(P)-dependent dehydrogenase (short-subunit alcohol dehydrogenase family)
MKEIESCGRAYARREDSMGYHPFEVDLSGRVALVTGANSGMGKETARELARMGAEVILACRSKERGEVAGNEIIETTRRKRAR